VRVWVREWEGGCGKSGTAAGESGWEMHTDTE
jgi:hypothetical protein